MAYLSWEEWQKQNPQPYDVFAFKQAGDQKYAGMQYDQRPKEWLDEYERQLEANRQWQAAYQNQVGAGGGSISNEATIGNPYVNVWNGAAQRYMPREESNIYGQGPNADPTIVPGGTPTGQTLQRNPVTGNYGGTTPAPNVPSAPGPTGGSWMTGDPSRPPQWVPDNWAIAMGGGQSPAASGGAAPNPFGAVSPRPLADYYDASDPFSAFRVEPLDPRFSQTQAAQVTPGGIADLMNPYLQSVRDQTLTDIERQRQLAQMTTDDQANAAKAFGGNRHGVANALTNDAFARQSAQQYANLNAQGYNAAANLATQNAGLSQQAGLANAANYMTGRGQDITQNQPFMNNALAQRAQDINQNQFNANLGLQQRGQDIGWNLGQMGQQLNAYNVAGSLLDRSGNMDWNSLNQANSATSQPGSSTTTTPGADPWNTLIGGLVTGWGLTRP